MATIEAEAEKKTPFQLSIEVQLLVKRMSSMQVGDRLTYEEMREICGHDVWHKYPQKVASARRIMQRDHNVIFAAVDGEALQRLSEKEKVSHVGHDIELLHRKTRRVAKRAACVDSSKLERDDKSKHLIQTSQLGVIAVCTSGKAAKKLSLAVDKATEPMPPSKTLELLKD